MWRSANRAGCAGARPGSGGKARAAAGRRGCELPVGGAAPRRGSAARAEPERIRRRGGRSGGGRPRVAAAAAYPRPGARRAPCRPVSLTLPGKSHLPAITNAFLKMLVSSKQDQFPVLIIRGTVS